MNPLDRHDPEFFGKDRTGRTDHLGVVVQEWMRSVREFHVLSCRILPLVGQNLEVPWPVRWFVQEGSAPNMIVATDNLDFSGTTVLVNARNHVNGDPKQSFFVETTAER